MIKPSSPLGMDNPGLLDFEFEVLPLLTPLELDGLWGLLDLLLVDGLLPDVDGDDGRLVGGVGILGCLVVESLLLGVGMLVVGLDGVERVGGDVVISEVAGQNSSRGGSSCSYV